MANKLTIKQEAFANLYIQLDNASEAYRQAGYSTEAEKDKSIWEMASKILSNHKVATRVKELKEELLKDHKVDRDYIINGLKKAQRIATNRQDSGNIRGAYMDMAKITGILDEKPIVVVNNISKDQESIVKRFLERNKSK